MMATSDSKRIAGPMRRFLVGKGVRNGSLSGKGRQNRLYGPEEAAFDKSFVLPDIEKVR